MITITDSDIQKYIGSTTGLIYSDLEDAIEVVTNRYVLPYLSQAQLIVSDASASNIHIVLMKVVKRAVINLAYAKDYMKFVLTSEASAVKDKATKEAKATKEDKEAHRETFWLEGFASIDTMLEILEENKSVFSQWASSPAFSLLKDSFVYSTPIFQDCIDINNSRRTFLRLKPAIKELEMMVVGQVIDRNLRQTLIEKFTNNQALTPLENQVIQLYQGFICNHAMATSIKKGSITKDKAGTFTVYDDTSLNKIEGRKTPDKSLLTDVQEEYYKTANQYRGSLASLIAENKTELGLIPATKDTGFNFKNDPKKGYFV